MEVYTASGIQVRFWLAFDYYSDMHLLEMLTAQEPSLQMAAFCFIAESHEQRFCECPVQQKALLVAEGQ